MPTYDRRILEQYPLPLARAYRRFRNAAEVRERHDAAYYLFEIYLKYVASITIAYYLAGDVRDHRVNAALKGLAKPSLGEWLRFLREALRFLTEEKHSDSVIDALAEMLASKASGWGQVLCLFNALCSFRSGKTSAREAASLAMLLDEIVAYRNRVLGHGALLSLEHYERFSELFGKAFPELLDQSPFLTARRLVAFDRIEIEAASRIQCGVVEYMSDRPIRRDRPLTIPY